MKHQILVCLSTVLVLLFNACNKPQESTTTSISFAIEDYGGDTIRLFQTEPLRGSRINTQELVVDESGAGNLEIGYPDNSFVRIQIGDFFFSMVNSAGAELMVEGKAGDLPNSLTISGKGSLSNNYLLAKNSIISKYNELDGRYFFQLDSAEFWVRMKALNEEIDSLNSWLTTKKIDKDLGSLLVLESQQLSNVYILNYALVKRHTDSKYSVDIPYDENLFRSYSSAYNMVLGLNYEFQISGPAWRSSGASNNDSIAYIFPKILSETIDALGIPEYAKDYYIARMLFSNFGRNQSSPVIEDVYTIWLSKYPESAYKNSLEDAINNMPALARGKQAPIITGIDPSGNEFSTEQLKGKVIYIDVWATWCSPCVEKIPKMYALQEEFKDQNQIQFLFVSVDKDLDKWKDYISKLPGDGMHINANSSDIYKDYMMGGVPQYIVIDSHGNIYQSNAPAPDSGEIKSLLEEAIKQAG